MKRFFVFLCFAVLLISEPSYARTLFTVRGSAPSSGPSIRGGSGPVRIRLNSRALNASSYDFITADGIHFKARSAEKRAQSSRIKSGSRKIQVSIHNGRVRADKKSEDFVMSVAKSGRHHLHLYGMYHSGDASYVIRNGSDGKPTLERVDISRLPGCGGAEMTGIASDHQSDTQGSGEARASTTDGTITIDVAIIFTTEAQAYAPTEADRAAQAGAAASDANLAYQNSQIAQKVRVVAVDTTGGQGGNTPGNLLTMLQNSSDGNFDNAHTIRDQYGADVVSMFGILSSACGIGYVLTNPNNSSFSSFAFNVVSTDCISNRSFAHELGHNMGAQHDVENAGGGVGAYSYSYGYRFTVGGATYRTVMAYQPGTRIPYFSNPDVSYLGVATGTSTKNNALTLNNTASLVSAFRSTVVDPTNPNPVPGTGGGGGSGGSNGGTSPAPTAVPTEPLPVVPVFSKVKAKVSGRSCSVTGYLLDKSTGFPLAGQQIASEYSVRTKNSSKLSSTNGFGGFKVRAQRGSRVRLTYLTASKQVRCKK